jgi:hypothetical protein
MQFDNIIVVAKSEMRWAGHEAYMADIRNTNTYVGNLKRYRHFEEKGTD